MLMQTNEAIRYMIGSRILSEEKTGIAMVEASSKVQDAAPWGYSAIERYLEQ